MSVGNGFLQASWPIMGEHGWDVECYFYQEVAGSNIIPGGL